MSLIIWVEEHLAYFIRFIIQVNLQPVVVDSMRIMLFFVSSLKDVVIFFPLHLQHYLNSLKILLKQKLVEYTYFGKEQLFYLVRTVHGYPSIHIYIF